MAVYSVFAPPLRDGEEPAAERFRFVRDGFSWGAFLLGPVWIVWRRLWIVLVLYFVVSGILFIALRTADKSGVAAGIVPFFMALLMGLEASTLRRWTLRRNNWRDLGIVVADKRDAAERRFFEAWVTSEHMRAGAAAAGSSFAVAGDYDLSAAVRAEARGDRPVPRSGRRTVSVAIVDYGSGNLHSAAKAFERAAREEGIDQPIVVTSDPDAVARADRIVLPGVGAFADCKRGLDAVDGMVDALNDSVRSKGKPFLGICVGMQLLAERGHEKEVIDGLGWIGGEVDRIAPRDKDLKIPHMGWNTLNEVRSHPLLDGIPLGMVGLHAYFVHSYHLKVAESSDLVAEADYGGPVTAIVARDTYAGTQFHPEKSQRLGLRLIGNFLKWKP